MSTEAIVITVGWAVPAIAAGVWLIWFVKHMRGLRDPAFTGDPVRGTAQITSMERIGGLFSRYGRPTEVQCQFGLRVQLPGRTPYDTTIRHVVGARRVELPRELQNSELLDEAEPYDGPKLKPGATVLVATDSADLHVVRIDLTRPVTRGGPVT